MLLRFIVIVFFLNTSVSAQELYRWQDEQGQWHFGDAASSNGQDKKVVEVAAQTTNIVKTKKVKWPVKNTVKTKKVKSSKIKKLETLEEKKLRCDKKREELRFQAFRYDERTQYERECVSEMKW